MSTPNSDTWFKRLAFFSQICDGLGPWWALYNTNIQENYAEIVYELPIYSHRNDNNALHLILRIENKTISVEAKHRFSIHTVALVNDIAPFTAELPLGACLLRKDRRNLIEYHTMNLLHEVLQRVITHSTFDSHSVKDKLQLSCYRLYPPLQGY